MEFVLYRWSQKSRDGAPGSGMDWGALPARRSLNAGDRSQSAARVFTPTAIKTIFATVHLYKSRVYLFFLYANQRAQNDPSRPRPCLDEIPPTVHAELQLNEEVLVKSTTCIKIVRSDIN